MSNENSEKTKKALPSTHGIDTQTTEPHADGVGAQSLHEVGLTRPEQAATSPEEGKTSEDLAGSVQRQASDPETSIETELDTSRLNASTDQVQGADGSPIENATPEKIAAEGEKIEKANAEAAAKLEGDAEKKMTGDANKKAGEKTTKASAKSGEKTDKTDKKAK